MSKSHHPSTVEVTTTIANAEVCVPEDAAHKETKAFILTSEICMFSFVKSNQHRKVKWYNKKMELYKCFLHRKVTPHIMSYIVQHANPVSILEPVDFSVEYSKIAKTVPQLDIIVDSVRISLSYTVRSVYSSIMSGLPYVAENIRLLYCSSSPQVTHQIFQYFRSSASCVHESSGYQNLIATSYSH